MTDTISNADRDKRSKLNSTVAITVAIAATFMAIASIKAANLDARRGGHSSQAYNTWNYFQAKNTRQSLAESTVEQLRALQSVVSDPDTANKLTAAIAQNSEDVLRYAKEKEELRLKAEGLQAEGARLGIFHDQFDLSKAALAVSIAICGLTALTQKKWLLNLAAFFIAFGLFWGILGFFQVGLRTGFLTSWLS